MRTVSKASAFVPAFAMSGLEGSGISAAAKWRPAIAAGATYAQTNLASFDQAPPAALHTQMKHNVVTTPDAGRDNKGTSPWGFPV